MSAGAQLQMIRPDLKQIPNAPLPAGYGIRPMSMADIAVWTEIQRDAEPFLEIADDLFVRSFGEDESLIAERCYLITAADGIPVGAIAAWFSPDFRGADYGRIHWVAVRRAFQRRGLARSGMSYALRQLAR